MFIMYDKKGLDCSDTHIPLLTCGTVAVHEIWGGEQYVRELRGHQLNYSCWVIRV